MRKLIVAVFSAVCRSFSRESEARLSSFSGDTRANENMGLTSLHTLFIRLHNRLAASIFSMNPHWQEDVLFFETRRLVGAILQHITYSEFLPALIGSSRSRWEQFRYDPTVNRPIGSFERCASSTFRWIQRSPTNSPRRPFGLVTH